MTAALLLSQQERDVIEIVPMSMLTDDAPFMSYMHQMNDYIAKAQVHSLRKLHKFIQVCDV